MNIMADLRHRSAIFAWLRKRRHLSPLSVSQRQAAAVAAHCSLHQHMVVGVVGSKWTLYGCGRLKKISRL